MIGRRLLIAALALCALASSAAAQTVPWWDGVNYQTGGGGGGGGVNSVSGGAGINIGGSVSNPVVNLNTPVTTSNGGTGISAPTAHAVPIAAGAGPFTLLVCNGFLVGSGSAADPVCRVLAYSDLPNSGVTAGSYTVANITVNAQGIVTAASNGSFSNLTGDIATSQLAGTTTGVAFSMGAVTNSEVVYYPTPIGVTFPATFGGGNVFVSCATNPSESDAYTLKSGGTSLATLTLSTSCVLSFSTLAGSHVAVAGEKVEMDAPATASGNVSFAIQVTR